MTDIASLPDISRIVSASGDGSIHNWSVDSKETGGIFTRHGTVIRTTSQPLIASTSFAEAYFLRRVKPLRFAL
ncbi:hypothetical protein RFM99_26295 [Mesorhizobium sp. VK4C]|uniref:hypothetical protein n=1 Tax=Mesorhizobium captivum TaxID=3072319 RepID=UPI002A23D94F|nr:hypothetical protein [Mesorhizobium sp. VK4C]MDX8501911.1 hypothetical protein [Mesorhizobium sp. VK4C]